MRRVLLYSQRDRKQWVAQLPRIFWNTLLPLLMGIFFGISMDWFYLLLAILPVLVSFEYLNQVEIVLK